MMESVEFLISLLLCLVYIAVPISVVGGICYFFGRRQQGKQLDATKNAKGY